MFIRYFSAIEQPRVYGFLFHFQCIPTASTILKRKLSSNVIDFDQDCFIEDNTIESKSTKQSRSWRVSREGDRHLKKIPDSRINFDMLPHATALKKSRQKDHSVNKMLRKEENLHFQDFR